MKKLIAELMNHGYSERQAQMFIGKCFNTYMHLDPDLRKKLEEKYAVNNETVGD